MKYLFFLPCNVLLFLLPLPLPVLLSLPKDESEIFVLDSTSPDGSQFVEVMISLYLLVSFSCMSWALNPSAVSFSNSNLSIWVSTAESSGLSSEVPPPIISHYSLISTVCQLLWAVLCSSCNSCIIFNRLYITYRLSFLLFTTKFLCFLNDTDKNLFVPFTVRDKITYSMQSK